jgi:hypothetical protein
LVWVDISLWPYLGLSQFIDRFLAGWTLLEVPVSITFP